MLLWKFASGQHCEELMPVSNAALIQHQHILRVFFCFKRSYFLTTGTTHFYQDTLEKCQIVGSE